MEIREFEITKEMYKRAKEVEELYKKTGKLDCRTEEFRKLNNKTWKLAKKFEKEFTEEFDTLEIVNEYERRERKMNKNRGLKIMKKFEKEKTHAIAWMASLLALPVAIIAICKGATPLQIAWLLGVVVAIQLLHLLPEALKEKEVYNDEF